MKPNASSSPALFNPDSPQPDYSASLVNFGPDLPMRVPTVRELAAHLAGEEEHPMLSVTSTARTGEVSLLQGLMGGAVDALLDDYARDPKRYSAEVGQLLAAYGARPPGELTPEERRLLDMAVLEFAAAPRPVAPEPMRPKPRPAKLKPPPREVESIERGRPEKDAAPGVEPELYWWMK